MSTLNQDLQATHKILQFIEASKQQGEMILDQIPGLFAVINSKGEILRGNTLLAKYLGVEIEEMLYSKFANLFKAEEFAIFDKKIDFLRRRECNEIDFELNITTQSMDSKTHLWYVSRFNNSKDELFTVVGKDISELKAAQQNLIEIFSSVPLAILTIGANATISGQVSAYTEVLLEMSSLEGVGIKDSLFSKARNLTSVERDTLDALLGSIGNKELIYSVIKDELPTRFEVQMASGKWKWFSTTFQPIVYEGVVHKVMLILQDITQLVKAEQLQKNQSLLEEAGVARILQLKRMDPETQPIIFEELEELFGKTRTSAEILDIRSVCRYLHGIKGCARVSGLKLLMEHTHHAETILQDHLRDGLTSDEETLQQALNEVLVEWDEVNRLYTALVGVNKEQVVSDEQNSSVTQELKGLFIEYNKLMNVGEDQLKSSYIAREIMLTLESYNQHSIAQIESILKKNVESTAQESGKQVRLKFDWEHVYLDKLALSTLTESLTHILNNAVDHGIESSEQRRSTEKFAEGSVVIHGIDVDGQVIIRCVDDGGGFNVSKIRDVAIKNGMCSLDKAMSMSNDEIVEFIFADGFSSAEQLTTVSGRGIGLSAVKKGVEELGGTVRAICKAVGAEFELVIPSDRSKATPKREVPLGDVLTLVRTEISKLNENGYKIQFEIDAHLANQLENMTFFGEADAIVFAVLQLLSIISVDKCNKLLLSKSSNGILEIRMDGYLPNLDSSRRYILDTCALYLQQHRGNLRFVDGMALLHFGYVK